MTSESTSVTRPQPPSASSRHRMPCPPLTLPSSLATKKFKTVRTDEVKAPMDYAIVTGWQAIMNAIFFLPINGDLLKHAHLSNGFKIIRGKPNSPQTSLTSPSSRQKDLQATEGRRCLSH